MIQMDVDDLIGLYPRLYHMAEGGSWPSIHLHGLMTTSQIVDAYSPTPEIRAAILEQRRPRNVVLDHATLGQLVIRDQAPLREQFLVASLSDLTVAQWLERLNNRVFFWLHPDKLSTLLGARRYRNLAHDVVTVNTASLIASHADQIRLSPINSGATLYPNAPKRGSSTFATIDAYRYDLYRRRGIRNAIVELAVINGVPDIVQHVVRVERRRRDEVLDVLYP
jgi:hypothetical protein